MFDQGEKDLLRIATLRPIPGTVGTISVNSFDEPLLFQPLPYDGPLYIYLGSKDFVRAWVEGGKVPINPASKFKSLDRAGTQTPDEMVNILTKVTSREAYELFCQVMGHDPRAPTRTDMHNMQLETQDGQIFRLSGSVTRFEQESYISCMSTIGTKKKLEEWASTPTPKVACVELLKREELANIVSAALGVPTYEGQLGYTAGDQRGHFMKSVEDSWQCEYRMAWLKDGSRPITVELPAGMAREVDL